MSRACLQFRNGENLYCEQSKEYQVNRDWFRVELFRESPGEELKAAGYKRLGCYWVKHFDQRLAMEKRAMLAHALQLQEAA